MPGVTKEQIQAAREADLFAWLQSHEPGVLKRDGPNYRHKEHDSLVYVTGKRYAGLPKRGGKAGTERAGKETVYAALGQTVCYRRCFVFAAARDQFGCDQPVLSERAFL